MLSDMPNRQVFKHPKVLLNPRYKIRNVDPYITSYTHSELTMQYNHLIQTRTKSPLPLLLILLRIGTTTTTSLLLLTSSLIGLLINNATLRQSRSTLLTLLTLRPVRGAITYRQPALRVSLLSRIKVLGQAGLADALVGAVVGSSGAFAGTCDG